MEIHGCRNPRDCTLIESSLHAFEGSGTIGRPDDQLADEGVIERRDVVTRVNVTVDSDSRPTRRQPARDATWCGTEVVLGIFCVDPSFDRMAFQLDVVLLNADRITAGDA